MDEKLLLESFYIPETTLPFSAGIFRGNESEAHWHHYWEILYQIEGETLIKVGGEEFYSKEGEVTIIGAEEVHSTRKLTRNHSQLVFQFELSAVLPYNGILSQSQYLTNIMFNNIGEKAHFKISEEKDYMQDLMKKALSEYEQKEIGYEIEIQSYLLQMIVFFLRKEYLRFPELPEEQRQAINKVKPSILYVEQNFSEDISLEEVAKVSNVSIYNFCRTFKKATQRTFVEYLNYIRLREAEKMLLSTERSIGDISYAVGFSSVSYFNRLFKRKYGYPPFLYKKKNCGKEELECGQLKSSEK